MSGSLVSSIDIAPTLLELAEIDIPDSMDGRSFGPILQDPSAQTREYAVAEKNWHDFEDHARAVRDERFKYIRNYYEDLPNTPPADAVRSPTFEFMKQQFASGQLPRSQQGCFVAPRPREELYDTKADPHEMKNLASDPAYQAHLTRMRSALRRWEADTGDSVPKLRTADEFDRVTGKPTAARRRPRWSKAKMVAEGLVAP